MSHDLSYLEGGFVINDRYEIERSLGAGGFAVVYAGRDTQIDRSVAIKVMNTSAITKSEEAYAELVERFEREAKLAAKVEHPNVATIYDYGVVADHEDPFIIMELLEGRDLEEHLAEVGPMEPARAIDLMSETLVAVGLAHEAGIVHKDIKPSNLFLKNPGTRLETLSILDFGVAHITKAVQSRLTRAGEMTGTPGYIPPEYAQDQLVTPPLDVYQMALVLVEVLTGEMVVAHSQPSSALLAHVQGELPLPVPYLESDFGPVLARALAPDPEERYANGIEFGDDLAELDPASIPELEEDYETQHLAEHPVGMASPAKEKAVAAAEEARNETQEMHGGSEGTSEADEVDDLETADTQFMYGGRGEGSKGASEERPRTLSMEESSPEVTGEDDAESDADGSSENEVALGTRFEMDEPEMPAEEIGGGGSGGLIAGVIAVVLFGGGLLAYVMFAPGSETSPSDSGGAAVEESAESAGAASAEPDEGESGGGQKQAKETESSKAAAESSKKGSADKPTSASSGGSSESESVEPEAPPTEMGETDEGEETSETTTETETPPSELSEDDVPSESASEEGGTQEEPAEPPKQAEPVSDDETGSADDSRPTQAASESTSEKAEPSETKETADDQESDDGDDEVEVKLPTF